MGINDRDANGKLINTENKNSEDEDVDADEDKNEAQQDRPCKLPRDQLLGY